MEKAEGVVNVARRVGRPPIDRKPGMEIESNGLYRYQWERVKKMAETQHLDGSQLLRTIVQWFIDGTDAREIGVIATPEQDEDYSKLIQARKNVRVVSKNNKSKIRKVKKSRR